MSEEIRSNIFDPFYTTKEIGKGTELGFSSSHAIISDRHKGRICLESKMDKGAKFVLEFPVDHMDTVDSKTR